MEQDLVDLAALAISVTVVLKVTDNKATDNKATAVLKVMDNKATEDLKADMVDITNALDSVDMDTQALKEECTEILIKDLKVDMADHVVTVTVDPKEECTEILIKDLKVDLADQLRT